MNKDLAKVVNKFKLLGVPYNTSTINTLYKIQELMMLMMTPQTLFSSVSTLPKDFDCTLHINNGIIYTLSIAMRRKDVHPYEYVRFFDDQIIEFQDIIFSNLDVVEYVTLFIYDDNNPCHYFDSIEDGRNE